MKAEDVVGATKSTIRDGKGAWVSARVLGSD